MWTFGKNNYGQLGTGSVAADSLVPVQVTSLSGVVAIAAGQDHNLALKSDMTLWSWGRNNNKQLGDGTTTQRSSPVQVKTPEWGAILGDDEGPLRRSREPP